MYGVRDPKKRPLVWGAAAMMWALWISGLFGRSGLIQVYRLSQARQQIAARASVLEAEHDRLGKMLSAIEKDSTTQELAVREILGFARDQELIFEFRQEK